MTCEEYVLAELGKKDEQVRRLKELIKVYHKMMKDVNQVLEILERRFNLHKQADGNGVITMGYIFEDLDADEFNLMKDVFHLGKEKESGEQSETCEPAESQAAD